MAAALREEAADAARVRSEQLKQLETISAEFEESVHIQLTNISHATTTALTLVRTNANKYVRQVINNQYDTRKKLVEVWKILEVSQKEFEQFSEHLAANEQEKSDLELLGDEEFLKRNFDALRQEANSDKANCVIKQAAFVPTRRDLKLSLQLGEVAFQELPLELPLTPTLFTRVVSRIRQFLANLRARE